MGPMPFPNDWHAHDPLYHASHSTAAPRPFYGANPRAPSAAWIPPQATVFAQPPAHSLFHSRFSQPSALRAPLDVSAAPGLSTSCDTSPASSFASAASVKQEPSEPFFVMPPRPPVKRPSDDESPGQTGVGRMKLQRVDRGPDEFSGLVRDRMNSNTRTGQACDRCKIRKIRCDGLQEGCSQCANLGIGCFVTDRISGRTERRGYLQQLERDHRSLKDHIEGLQKLLGERGVEVKPWVSAAPWADAKADGVEEPSPGRSATQAPSADVRDSSSASHLFMPNFPRSKLESRPDEGHLGVERDNDNAPLSSLTGTRLSILGTTIDMGSFDAPDVDEPPRTGEAAMPLYNKSVLAFTQSTMMINPPIEAPLPPKDDALFYATWYFQTLSSFLPLLHQPTFMAMLTRIYDDPGFKPSYPDIICVHMALATIYYQFGVRNYEDSVQRDHFNNLSNKHYHYALSKFCHILPCRDLASVQALAMVAAHTRAFPKPGCGAIVANLALQGAIDINLHRAWKKPDEPTNLENELRKRAWWVILAVSMAIAGRLGRPMPITVEEFDVPFPEPIADELLSDAGVDESQSLPCPYTAGIAGFKSVPISIEIYSNIYSVRRDADNYANVVRALDRQLDEWEAEIPENLQLKKDEAPDTFRVAALYVKMFGLEARLCLRHPSVAMTKDQNLIAENTRICEETAREMLYCTTEILKLKALDTTWYQLSVYAMSAFSMLVAHWERRFETTPEKVAELRQDMNAWMEVLKHTCLLLGAGAEISSNFSVIINRTIDTIEHDMRGKVAAQPAPQLSLRPQQHLNGQDSNPSIPGPAPKPSLAEQTPTYRTPSQPGVSGTNGDSHPGEAHKGYYQDSSLGGQTAYAGLAYGRQSQAHLSQPPYNPHSSVYYASEAVTAAPPNGGVADPDPLIAYAAQAQAQAEGNPTPDMMWNPNNRNPWQDWAMTIMPRQDHYGANALMNLGNGGRDPMPGAMMPPPAFPPPGGAMGHVSQPQEGQWPYTIFGGPPASQP